MAITVVVLNTTTESEGDTPVDIEKGNYNDYSTFIISTGSYYLLDTTEAMISVVVSSDIMIIVVSYISWIRGVSQIEIDHS